MVLWTRFQDKEVGLKMTQELAFDCLLQCCHLVTKIPEFYKLEHRSIKLRIQERLYGV